MSFFSAIDILNSCAEAGSRFSSRSGSIMVYFFSAASSLFCFFIKVLLVFMTVCLLSENIIQPECRTVNSKSVKHESVESLKCISGIVYIPHDYFKPGSRHGTSHVTEQRNACFQQSLAESKQSVTYRLHMTLYVKLIDNKPVMLSYHGILRRICF